MRAVTAQAMTAVDWELSRTVAREVGARTRECYSNAARAVLNVRLEGRNPCYVEGAAVVLIGEASLVALEHAWVELADGQVVEPTWVLDGTGEARAYFPIGKWDVEAVVEAVVERRKFPLLWTYGFGGCRHPQAAPAWDAARAWVAAQGTAEPASCGGPGQMERLR